MKKTILKTCLIFLMFDFIAIGTHAQNNIDTIKQIIKFSLQTSWNTYALVDHRSDRYLSYTDLGIGIQRKKHELFAGIILGPHIEPYIDRYYSFTEGSAVTGKFKNLFLRESLNHWGIRGFDIIYKYKLPQSEITYKKCGLNHKLSLQTAFLNYNSTDRCSSDYPDEFVGKPVLNKRIVNIGLSYNFEQKLYKGLSVNFEVINGLFVSQNRFIHKVFELTYPVLHNMGTVRENIFSTYWYLQGRISFSYSFDKKNK